MRCLVRDQCRASRLRLGSHALASGGAVLAAARRRARGGRRTAGKRTDLAGHRRRRRKGPTGRTAAGHRCGRLLAHAARRRPTAQAAQRRAGAAVRVRRRGRRGDALDAVPPGRSRVAIAEARRVLRPAGLFAACTASRRNDPELTDGYPPSPFDAEEAPAIVASVFGDVDVDSWDGPYTVLPDRDAVLRYCRSHFLPPEAADRATPPVTLT